MLNSRQAVLPAVTGLLIAAKGKFDRGYIKIVDPAGTCLQLMNDPVTPFDVIRKHTGSKSINFYLTYI